MWKAGKGGDSEKHLEGRYTTRRLEDEYYNTIIRTSEITELFRYYAQHTKSTQKSLDKDWKGRRGSGEKRDVTREPGIERMLPEAGFRKGRSTIVNIFVLNHLV